MVNAHATHAQLGKQITSSLHHLPNKEKAPDLAERVQLRRLHGYGAQRAQALQAVNAGCVSLARRRCRQCIHLQSSLKNAERIPGYSCLCVQGMAAAELAGQLALIQRTPL